MVNTIKNICMILVRDTESMPDVDHSLITPFLKREADINVKSTPKFQVEILSIDDHSVNFPGEILRMRLKLHGVFS